MDFKEKERISSKDIIKSLVLLWVGKYFAVSDPFNDKHLFIEAYKLSMSEIYTNRTLIPS